MSVYSTILCNSSNSFTAVKLLQNVNNKVYLLKKPLFRNFCNMSQKVCKNDSKIKSRSYIAVNIHEGTLNARKGRVSEIFRRFRSTSSKDKSTLKSDVVRLLSLAKPEKWNLLGRCY